MNATARLTSIPGPKKSRKKGRRDKPLRMLKIPCILEKLLENQTIPEPVAPKPYVPQPITDFTPPAGMNPKMAKKLRRKWRRKNKKEMAKQEAEQQRLERSKQEKAESEAQAAKKRKADEEMYQEYSKKAKTGDTESAVEGRTKIEPKSRKPKAKPQVQMPANNAPEPGFQKMPVEILRNIFDHGDLYTRACTALTCRKFGTVIMQDLLDRKEYERWQAENAGKTGTKKGPSATSNATTQGGADKSYGRPKGMGVGVPDLRKRYNWDGERHAVMEHLHSSIANDHQYCTVCRKYKPVNGGIVESYKNCPKKTMMADAPAPTQATNERRPAGMLAPIKKKKVQPTPDKIVWTENDWSVIKLGAIRSRMGHVDTHYLCPSCTDSRNSFLFPPPSEMPLVRFIEVGNPIGGDTQNGRVPYGQEGPNVRDPRRTYPPEEKIDTVEDMARTANADAHMSGDEQG